MTTTYHFTLVSNNSKTGHIPVTTTSRDTCPPSCALYIKGCYGGGGPIALHWRKVTEGKRGGDINYLTRNIESLPVNQLWRHDQVGDLPGKGNRIKASDLARIVRANLGKRGFTYTHKPVLGSTKLAASNREAVRLANEQGFTINLSANHVREVDALVDLGIGPVVTVLPQDAPATSFTPAGRKIIVCPAQQKEGVTCATCQLCSIASRKVVIGFIAHGSAAKAAEKNCAL